MRIPRDNRIPAFIHQRKGQCRRVILASTAHLLVLATVGEEEFPAFEVIVQVEKSTVGGERERERE